jgi:sarcosine oxidase
MGEGRPYGQLAKRSHALWRQIERDTLCELMTTTGGLLIGSKDGNHESYIRQTIRAAERDRIEHEVLVAAEIRRRFPLFQVGDDDFAYFEPNAGLLKPERCIAAQLGLAQRHGAQLRLNERVLAIEETVDGVRLKTDQRVIVAAQAVLAVGPWLAQFLGSELARVFRVYRQVQFWFAANDEWLGTIPVFIWELRGRKKGLYGLPGVDGGSRSIKIASEQYETLTTATTFDGVVSSDEVDAIRTNFVRQFLPTLDGRCTKTVACMYTMTPDAGFVIDRHPTNRRLLIASPCSGHGFKHSAAVGEAIAELLILGSSKIDLSPLRLCRFDS